MNARKPNKVALPSLNQVMNSSLPLDNVDGKENRRSNAVSSRQGPHPLLGLPPLALKGGAVVKPDQVAVKPDEAVAKINNKQVAAKPKSRQRTIERSF